MRQCLRCSTRFADDLVACPDCNFNRSFSIAGTTRIRAAVAAAPAAPAAGAAVAAMPAPALGAGSLDDGEWSPCGIRWAGITMIGMLFPLLVVAHFFQPESVFLLLMQWLTVLMGVALVAEKGWAVWLAGLFAGASTLREVRGMLLSAAMGEWAAVAVGALVSTGLILALVMLAQGWDHPGTKRLVKPAVALVAINLLLVMFGGRVVASVGDEEDMGPPSAKSPAGRTEQTFQQMQETIETVK